MFGDADDTPGPLPEVLGPLVERLRGAAGDDERRAVLAEMDRALAGRHRLGAGDTIRLLRRSRRDRYWVLARTRQGSNIIHIDADTAMVVFSRHRRAVTEARRRNSNTPPAGDEIWVAHRASSEQLRRWHR